MLVLLVGPQASGKSTVARALKEELRRHGERVALVELDQIAEMARPTLPSWDAAARIFAMVAGEWAREDLTCVIAEGIASQGEVEIVRCHTPAAAVVVTVVMTTPFEAALPRAQEDRSAGVQWVGWVVSLVAGHRVWLSLGAGWWARLDS